MGWGTNLGLSPTVHLIHTLLPITAAAAETADATQPVTTRTTGRVRLLPTTTRNTLCALDGEGGGVVARTRTVRTQGAVVGGGGGGVAAGTR